MAAFGQFGVVLPDKDLFVILTTEPIRPRTSWMEFFEEIVPTLTDSAQEASAAADVLKERTGQLAIKAVLYPKKSITLPSSEAIMSAPDIFM